MTQRPASRLRRLRGRRGARLLATATLGLAVACGGVACGTTRYTYAGSGSLGFVFRVPQDWQEVSSDAVRRAIDAAQDPTFARDYPFLIGFNATPDAPPVRFSRSALPEYPLVVSFVHRLNNVSQDTVSLKTLRNVLYTVDADENEGITTQLSYRTFTLSGGFWGSKILFVRRPSPAQAGLEVLQMAAADVALRYEYVLIVSCSTGCFTRNQGTIFDVMNSWRLKA
jgi:hypothetical protein